MLSLLKRYFAVSLVVAVPLLAAQVGGPGVPGVSEKLDVRVINVDAHVSDAEGKPFLGLSAADFEILEDGQPQQVTNFFIVEKAGVRSADGPVQSDARFRRRVAIVVDNNNIEKRDRDEALLIFEKFADESIGPDAEWSVGIIGERFELLQPFTTDKAALKGGLKKVRDTPARVSMTDLRRDLLSDSLRRNQARDGLDYEGTVGFANREQTQRGAQSALSTVKGIVEATRAYGQSEGKKVMFLISGGMQLNTTFSAYDKKGSDGEVNDARREIQKLLEGVVQEANAVDVSIDVIAARTRGSLGAQFDVENASAGFNRPTLPRGVGRDPADSKPPGSAMSQAKMNDPIDVGDNDSSNFKIAAATGGLYLTSNRVRDSYELAETSSSHYYSLGYRPTHPEDGEYHAITVRLKKPGYRLTHRQGYLDLSPEQQLQELLRLRVSTLQLSTAVPVSLEVAPATTPDGKPAVGFTATMPMKNITFLGGEGGAAYNGRVHVYLSIFDHSGKNVGFHHVTRDVVVPANLREKALADTFRYKMSMKLDRGEYTLAVTLRDDLSREIGTAVQKVKL